MRASSNLEDWKNRIHPDDLEKIEGKVRYHRDSNPVMIPQPPEIFEIYEHGLVDIRRMKEHLRTQMAWAEIGLELECNRKELRSLKAKFADLEMLEEECLRFLNED